MSWPQTKKIFDFHFLYLLALILKIWKSDQGSKIIEYDDVYRELLSEVEISQKIEISQNWGKNVSKSSRCVGFTSKGSTHPQCTFSPLFFWSRSTWASRTGIFFYFRHWNHSIGFQGRKFLLFLFSAIQSISLPSAPLLAKLLSPWNVSHTAQSFL